MENKTGITNLWDGVRFTFELEYPSTDVKFLANATALIEDNLCESDFSLEYFSQKLNMSKSSLYRKMKSLTRLSPFEFAKKIRMKNACYMLKHKKCTITEIAYIVGFTDPKYFTFCFKAEFGLTPTDYLRRSREGD
jgi:AraC-like DNA-binding protein